MVSLIPPKMAAIRELAFDKYAKHSAVKGFFKPARDTELHFQQEYTCQFVKVTVYV